VLTPSRIVLLPLAAAAVCQPVQATTYLSIEQAQQLLFADQTLAPIPLALSADQIATIERESGTHYYPGAVRAWRADSGVLFIDAVIGKHDLITYAVAVTTQGKVRQVEILEYREAYGGEVRSNSFRKQFVGRSHADPVQIGHDIQNISGATLSCQHVTDGIRRLLALYDVALTGK
jgi:Na+-translocating ferredoxin:NAD+ oxidoreductase RnfG subunit